MPAIKCLKIVRHYFLKNCWKVDIGGGYDWYSNDFEFRVVLGRFAIRWKIGDPWVRRPWHSGGVGQMGNGLLGHLGKVWGGT